MMSYAKLLLLFLCCCLGTHLLFSQQSNQKSIDSLYARLNKDITDIDRIEVHFALYDLEYKEYNLPKAKENANLALIISDSIGYDLGKVKSLILQAKILWVLEDIKSALDCNLQALAINKTLDAPQVLIQNYVSLSHNYIFLKEYDQALAYIKEAANISKNLDNPEQLANVEGLQAFIYMEMGNYEKAEEFFLKIYKYGIENDDTLTISAISADIAMLYHRQEKNTKALKFGKIAQEASLKTGDSRQIEQAYKQIEKIYIDIEDFESAYATRIKYNELGGESRIKEFSEKISSMELKSALEKENAIRERKNYLQRTIRNIIGLLLFMAIAFIVTLYRQSQNLKKEQEKNESLLLNILPANIAKELKIKGHAEAKDVENVSILFTDFIGFTEIAQEFSSTELVDELNSCFKAFDLFCEEYNVEKIKTIGDAYMAAGGIPDTNPQSAKNTVLTALKMQEFIQSRNLEKNEKGKLTFTMRAGIHTGPVVAGIVGTKKFQYDIWGDTVNTASRMESNSVVGRVNISQSTYEIIKEEPEFTFEHRGRIASKGKGELEMWYVSSKFI